MWYTINPIKMEPIKIGYKYFQMLIQLFNRLLVNFLKQMLIFDYFFNKLIYIHVYHTFQNENTPILTPIINSYKGKTAGELRGSW